MEKSYTLGNCLRGHFTGKFISQEIALGILSARFLLSYPNGAGRFIQMYVNSENDFGFKQDLICYEGLTRPNLDLSDAAITEQCERSHKM